MFKETLRILSLFELQPKIEGRKRIQKIFFILKYLGYDVPFYYSYHFYGPYSEELQAELSSKACLKLWEEKHTKKSGYVYEADDKKILEFKKLISRLTDEDVDAPFYPKELVIRLAATDAEVLELASTLWYFIEQDFGADRENVYTRAKEETLKLKPNLKEKMPQAEKLYEDLQKERKSA